MLHGLPSLADLVSRTLLHGSGANLIVVVDRRTMLLAQERIAEAIAVGDLARANYGLVSLLTWLHHEWLHCADDLRGEYAALREHAAAQKATVNTLLGAPETGV